ncbi:hypothetical protein BBI01_14475 [Chryseobacterium artocarpi]|uniref:Uncharacterized protein n=1 Tax=Chryseobacterium artocarpi TaxID=1414727 RepID=A0A1B8ZCK1_9FLAO|nr:hypothetical protein [Chryseobacterium artocarpi]OCA69352.1 hypothetical protein BBI01_14475 [Chryseobacterium artocarpi]
MNLEELNKKIEKEYNEYLSGLGSSKKVNHLKEIQEFDNSMNKFWKEEYPKMGFDEKKKYWLASTHKGMRTQGEVLGDEYSEFSKGWYDFAKEHEPDFDEIFDYVTKNLGFEFDWEEYNKRIEN